MSHFTLIVLVEIYKLCNFFTFLCYLISLHKSSTFLESKVPVSRHDRDNTIFKYFDKINI